MASKGEFSAASPDYGTPPEHLDAMRRVIGGEFDLDPCTSKLFNEVVRARRIFTREDDSLRPECVWQGNCLVNAPGDRTGELVKRVWEKLIEQYIFRSATSAFWVGFNINQLQTLQQARTQACPMHFPYCVPAKRMEFSQTFKDHQTELFGEPDRTLMPATDPGHPNFIAFLPDPNKPWQAETFYREFSKFGAVSRPVF